MSGDWTFSFQNKLGQFADINNLKLKHIFNFDLPHLSGKSLVAKTFDKVNISIPSLINLPQWKLMTSVDGLYLKLEFQVAHAP